MKKQKNKKKQTNSSQFLTRIASHPRKKAKTFIRFQHCNLIFHFLHEKASVDLLKLDLTAPRNKPHNLCSYSTEIYCFMLNFNISKLVCYRWFLCHKAEKTTRAFAFRLKCYFILKRHFSASRVFPVSFYTSL